MNCCENAASSAPIQWSIMITPASDCWSFCRIGDQSVMPPCTSDSSPSSQVPPESAIACLVPSAMRVLYSESPTTMSTLLFFGVHVPASTMRSSDWMKPTP